ncbi:MAG TPA: G8 domain-containing protein [Tepidisphaeraceae bacterium]|nr:G8 domain-containing protein [Tepidisphaeraceae bacterium]
MKRTAGWIFLGLLALMTVAGQARAGNVAFSIRSARGGNWSDRMTWQPSRVPGAGDTVQVRAGDTVVYDVASDAPIRMIHVAGTLTFSHEKSTRLCVGLIKIQPGTTASEEGFDCDAHSQMDTPDAGDAAAPANTPALEIGTLAQPIPANVTATVRLVYFPGADKETLPAIIDCGGRWDVHGAPMTRTWLKLGAPAMAGADRVTLAGDPGGWKAGDQVLLTGSYLDEFRPRQRPKVQSETRRIVSIAGNKLKLDQPLAGDHVAAGAEVTEAADLSRNVVIESADFGPKAVRGHTMYHHGSTGGISYAEFRHLGKKNVLGKYPIHFHHVRDSMRGSAVVGASIWDSQNRFIAIHGTDYLLVRDCVGYGCVGHGFFLEDATEQYNILDRNLAVGARRGKALPHQVLGFDDNEGSGFWWANGRNTFTRNVACENGTYGYKFQIEKIHDLPPMLPLRQPDGNITKTDIRTVPFFRLEDNESHGDGLYAFAFGDDPAGSVHSDSRHPFIAKSLRAWQSHYALRSNTWQFLMDGLTINHAVYGVYHPDYADHVYRNIYLNTVISEPINRGHDDESIQNGSFTYENLTLENCRIGRDPLIQLTCTSPRPGQQGDFRNVTIKNSTSHDSNIVDLGGGPRNDKLENGVVYYFHDMPAPGRAIKVVSVHFPQLMNDGDYKSIPGFTGPDVRAAEVPDPLFPRLLDPIDDLPPATLITSVQSSAGKIRVQGVSEDNGEVTAVLVNGKPAKIISSQNGVADWEITIDAKGVNSVEARATDAAGNIEKTPAIGAVRM